MSEFIKDGTGKGYLAQVNADNQLVTRATAVEQRLHSTIDSNYFEATTGVVTLTDAAESDILYITYTGEKKLVIDRVFYDTWKSTGGTVNTGTLKYYHNITSVTGGTAATVTNTHLGTTNTLDATITKSTTFTGGTVWWSALFTAGVSAALEEGRIVLSPGASFGISVAADTSNSSMKVNINVAMYEFDPTLIQ